jgi:hypothetical protein
VIDAGQSFAAGQVYVALSRCRTLGGLKLLSQIKHDSVKSDERIIAFSKNENRFDEIKRILTTEKPKYAARLLVKVFDWRIIIEVLEIFLQDTELKKFSGKLLAFTTVNAILKNAKTQQKIAEKFTAELEKKFFEIPLNQKWLTEKVSSAKQYFSTKIKEELIIPLNGLQSQLKGKTKVRKYAQQTDEVEKFLWKKIDEVQRAAYGEYSFEVKKIERDTTINENPQSKGMGVQKGASKVLTFEFYKQGMSIADIAKQRDMAISTIEEHLAAFVQNGQVNVFDFVSIQELEQIKQAVSKMGHERLTPLLIELGDKFSYGKIKMALAHFKSSRST